MDWLSIMSGHDALILSHISRNVFLLFYWNKKSEEKGL